MVKQQFKHVCCIFTQFINYKTQVLNQYFDYALKIISYHFQVNEMYLAPSLYLMSSTKVIVLLTLVVGNPKRHTSGESCQTR